jgi:hypothetical protein
MLLIYYVGKLKKLNDNLVPSFVASLIIILLFSLVWD